jgi:hypothetical protein
MGLAILLMGDLNGHVKGHFSDHHNDNGRQIEALASTHGLSILNSGGLTHRARHGADSCIDFVLADSQLGGRIGGHQITLSSPVVSDHLPLMVKVQVSSCKGWDKDDRRRVNTKVLKAREKDFQELLLQELEGLLAEGDVEAMYPAIMEKIMDWALSIAETPKTEHKFFKVSREETLILRCIGKNEKALTEAARNEDRQLVEEQRRRRRALRAEYTRLRKRRKKGFIVDRFNTQAEMSVNEAFRATKGIKNKKERKKW